MLLKVILLMYFASLSYGASIVSKDLCVINGKTYQIGELTNPNPCKPCKCGGGNLLQCAIVDCGPVMCADPVRPAGQCCQTCRNGQNCKHGRHIIKMGEVYKPDAHTSCQCNRQYFGALATNCTYV